MQSGYSLSDIATTNSLSLTINPVSICSLDFTPNANVNELTAAFQTAFSVTTDVFNETSSTSHTCQVTANSLTQLIILQNTPNSQVTPSAEFTGMVPDNLTLQCNWLLTPGGIYNGRSVITPISTHRLSENITLRNFTFQITPVDGEFLFRNLYFSLSANMSIRYRINCVYDIAIFIFLILIITVCILGLFTLEIA